MFRKMPHILCAFMHPNDQLLQPIYAFGQRHGWLIELCRDVIPRDWQGDGVISDYLTLEDLSAIRDIGKIPIVSRILPPGGNVRSVLSDTRAVAEMAVDFFVGQGFQIFAAISTQEFPGEVCGIPICPSQALRELTGWRGLECHFHYCVPRDGVEPSYPEMLAGIRNFLESLPKPVALILVNPQVVAPVWRAVEELGLRVPEKVAILCNSQRPLYTTYTPVPLSGIDGEHGTVGLKLAETMQKMLDGGDVPLEPEVISPSAVIRRASTDIIAVPHLKLATAIRFLIQNCDSPVGIGEAARYAELSQSMLNRLFRRHLGRTGIEFLQQLRIDRMKNLLDSTELSLSEIAAQNSGSTPSQSPDTLIGRRLPGGALLFMLCRTNSASGERRNAFTRILLFMYIENRAFHLLPRISRASPEITYRTHSVGSVPLPAWSRHI